MTTPSPLERAARVEAEWILGPTAQPSKSSRKRAAAVLTAALDDPDLGGRFRDWRHTPCEHSRPLRYGPEITRPEPELEQACSPCMRDRMLTWLLGTHPPSKITRCDYRIYVAGTHVRCNGNHHTNTHDDHPEKDT